MSKKLRVDFHRAVYDNLNFFINIIDSMGKNAEIIHAHSIAPDVLKNGRTFQEIMLDDAMNAFASVMRDVPDTQIPISFYKQLMSARYSGKNTTPIADRDAKVHLNKFLSTHRALSDDVLNIKTPDFIEIYGPVVPQQQMTMMHVNWKALVTNFGQLTFSDEAFATISRSAKMRTQSEIAMSDILQTNEDRTTALKKIKGTPTLQPVQPTEIEVDAEEEAASLEKIAERVRTLNMSVEARKRARKEIARLSQMNPQSSEYSTVFNYVDTLTSMPWGKISTTHEDVGQTETILDEDHYGMEKIKEAIAEHVAVQGRRGKSSGKILLLVGPPGVGKTSIAKSVARATGRNYVRMALGGVDDEAKIRGHKMTYVGAMPGDIVKAMIKARTDNPLITLDEVDKLGRSMRGDPTAALLEALDPEQNNTFKDHYLDVEYDLSNVMFLCTANEFWNIPPALRDRMEVIHLPGYLQEQKFEIAKRYLLPKQLKENGLTAEDISIDDAAINRLIVEYTREAGVRSLERIIGKVCSKVVMAFAKGETGPIAVSAENLSSYAGLSKITHDRIDDEDKVGVVNGLAYTTLGGCRLPIQTAIVPSVGPFRLNVTGSLGDVMRESITVAEGLIRSRAAEFGIAKDRLMGTELRLHAPEGAVPKDGPSAGLAMTTVIISALTNIKIRRDVAMTGEIDLKGNAMKIGGLPEKLEGALRAGVKTVIIPKDNESDLADVPEAIKSQLKIIPVTRIEEVLSIALTEKLPTLNPVQQVTSDTPTADEIRKVFNWLGKAGNDNAFTANLMDNINRKQAAPSP